MPVVVEQPSRPASVSSSARASASEPSRRWSASQDELGRRGSSAPAGGRRPRRSRSCRQPQAALEPAQVARRARRPRAAAPSSRNSSPASRWTSVGVDGVDGGERLVERQDPVVERLLAADPRREVAGLVHPQLEAAGEVRLRLRELLVRDELVAQPGELGEDRVERRRQAVRVDARPRPRARRRRRSRRGPTRRRRRGPAPRGPTGTAGCDIPSPRTALRTARVQASGWSRRRAGTPTTSWAWRRVAPGPDGRAVAGRQRGRRREARDRRRCRSRTPSAASADRLVVAEVAGDRDDRVRRPVHRPPEVADRRPRAGPGCPASSPQISRPSGPSPNIACWNRIWAYSAGSSRYERISSTMTVRSLSISVVVEARPDDELAEDVHRPGRLAPRDADPVDGRLAVRRGVERAADALDRLAEIARVDGIARSCP